MVKRIVCTAAAVLALLFGTVGSAAAGNHLFAPPERVVICHVQTQNTLTVTSTSLKGHLRHGDVLGAC